MDDDDNDAQTQFRFYVDPSYLKLLIQIDNNMVTIMPEDEDQGGWEERIRFKMGEFEFKCT